MACQGLGCKLLFESLTVVEIHTEKYGKLVELEIEVNIRSWLMVIVTERRLRLVYRPGNGNTRQKLLLTLHQSVSPQTWYSKRTHNIVCQLSGTVS